LPQFVQKLRENFTRKKKRKIRIAYFGDSMIEGDLITQTFRNLLQKQFGGAGVGFIPVNSVTAKFRQTATTNSSSNWNDISFRDKKRNLYLSGHVFKSNSGKISITDNLRNDTSNLIEKSLICGYTNHNIPVIYNGSSLLLNPEKNVNRILLSKDINRKIELTINDETLPVYGVSFESESGVIIDNFSYRGITGIELSKIETTLLESLAKNNPYDLIVFQYGVNLLFRPNDVNFNYYERAFNKVLNKFTNAFPNSEFLLISTADRAFRYNGEYKSAIGIDSLVKTQATLAYEYGIAFYNQFESMGGKNSIVEWVNQSPSLAGRDYIHPNARGAEFLADYLFEALMNDYKKYCSNLSK
jgi:lysophospholipase L1-like esterase